MHKTATVLWKKQEKLRKRFFSRFHYLNKIDYNSANIASKRANTNCIPNETPQGGNEIEITLRVRQRAYGGMKLYPIVVEKR